MCRLLETIRIESGFAVHLDYHQERMDRCAGQDTFSLNHYISDSVMLPPLGLWKLRLVYDKETILYHELMPYVPRLISSLKIIHASNLNYSQKFEDRTDLNILYQQKDDCDDILILQNNLICDTSFSNILFFNGQRWVTPDTPLLAGTARSRLLHEKRITSQCISICDLPRFSHFMLINALLDFDETRAIPFCLSVTQDRIYRRV